MTISLDHIGLYVKDLDRSLRFYHNVFDFPEKYRYNSEVSKMVVLDVDGNLLELLQLPDSPAEPPKGRWRHIAFHVDDYNGVVSKLEEMGVELRKVTASDGFRIAFFKDPDGYDIEIMEKGLHSIMSARAS